MSKTQLSKGKFSTESNHNVKIQLFVKFLPKVSFQSNISQTYNCKNFLLNLRPKRRQITMKCIKAFFFGGKGYKLT